FRNGLYFLILAPSGATWSLDQFLRRRRAVARGEPASDEPVLIEPWSVPLFICRLLTWGTLAFELTFIVLVWFRPLRRWILLAGLGLHLGILMTMEIGWFSQVTMCWYALFVSGKTLSRWESRGEGSGTTLTSRLASPGLVSVAQESVRQ